MNKLFCPLLATILLVCCCCCNTSKKIAKTEKYPLVGTHWSLVSVEGVEISHDFAMRPYVVFDSIGHLQGNLGCNTFFGTYEVNKRHKIKVNYEGATKRLCQQMGMEKQFISAWRQDINHYQIKDGELILYANEEEIMRFSGTDLSKVE